MVASRSTSAGRFRCASQPNASVSALRASISTVDLTQEQRAIVEFGRAGKGHLLIEALAGSGKSETLRQMLPHLPQKSILICAFNKRIADDFKRRLPRMPTHAVHVRTFHAQGLSIIKHHYPNLGIKEGVDASEELINKACDARGIGKAFKPRRAAVKLLKLYKEVEVTDPASLFNGVLTGTAMLDPEDLLVLGQEYNLFEKLNEREIDVAIQAMMDAYDLSLRPENLESIDFCDMVWMPIALNLTPPSRYKAIIVDEWQDLSEPQLALVQRLLAPDGRLIMAGDFFQAIYAWRGAAGETVREYMQSLGAKTLPLTMTFRCGKNIVAEAVQLVPALRAKPDAIDGEVHRIERAELPRWLVGGVSEEIHTFILSRSNSDLLDCALFLWRSRCAFQLNAGREMLEPLFHLLEFVLDLRSPGYFINSLNSWWTDETAKAERANATAWKERIDEQNRMLLRALQYSAPTGIKQLLSSILKAGQSGVLLSTVHKVKGLEADRVFLLKQTFARQADHVDAPIKYAPTQEELNIEYVAITRAREHLIWVDLRQNLDVELSPIGQGSTAKLSTSALEALWITAEREAQRLDASGDADAAKDQTLRAIELKKALDLRLR